MPVQKLSAQKNGRMKKEAKGPKIETETSKI